MVSFLPNGGGEELARRGWRVLDSVLNPEVLVFVCVFYAFDCRIISENDLKRRE